MNWTRSQKSMMSSAHPLRRPSPSSNSECSVPWESPARAGPPLGPSLTGLPLPLEKGLPWLWGSQGALRSPHSFTQGLVFDPGVFTQDSAALRGAGPKYHLRRRLSAAVPQHRATLAPRQGVTDPLGFCGTEDEATARELGLLRGP